MQACLQEKDLWEQEIVPRLPMDLDKQAKLLGALVRKRGIKSASDLLRALLSWVLCNRSGRQLGSWAVLLGIAERCEKAWRVQLGKCGDWLLWLLNSHLQARLLATAGAGRVVLIDGTKVQPPGGGAGEVGWLAQLVYEVRTGTLIDLRIGDPHQAESVLGLPLEQGDVLLGDRGFTRRNGLLALARQKVLQLGRWSQTGVRLQRGDAHPFQMDAWVACLRSDEVIVETQAWVQEEQESVPVRVLALRLPPEQAERARARLIKQARSHRQLRESTLRLAGWIILLSTLPPCFSASELFWLYRCRWQIERLIKAMKQLLPLAHLRCKTAPLIRVTLLAWLLAWVWSEQGVQEVINELKKTYQSPQQLQDEYQQMSQVWEAEEARLQTAQLTLAQPTSSEPTAVRATPSIFSPDRLASPTYLCSPTSRQQPPSRWLIQSCALGWLTSVVAGQWKWQRLFDCLPRLGRFFCPGKRRRCSQGFQLEVWVLARFAPFSASGHLLNLNSS